MQSLIYDFISCEKCPSNQYENYENERTIRYVTQTKESSDESQNGIFITCIYICKMKSFSHYAALFYTLYEQKC